MVTAEKLMIGQLDFKCPAGFQSNSQFSRKRHLVSWSLDLHWL